LLVVFLLSVFGNSGPLIACNVPVFRFALERWRPDPYRAVLFHRGALSDTDQALLEKLEVQATKPIANLAVELVDLENSGAALPPQLQASNAPQLPWLSVHYPEHLRIESPAWSGPLNPDSLAALNDSPIRRELVKRLIDGETAVWLFLESGDPDKDQTAIALVEQELNKLTQELKLPELTDSPDDALLSSSPLRIAFSLLRVSRDDGAERGLAEMLLHSESDLLERSDPLVFPVFGRGRALFPLVGPGINADNIRESASFLVGPCSCQVKELNPGFDLLLAADWDDLLNQEGVVLTALPKDEQKASTKEIELVPIPAGSGSKSIEPTPVNESTSQLATKTALTSAAPSPTPLPVPSLRWTGVLGLLVIVVTSLVLLLMRR
jgi:hypothetical protein